MKKNNILNQNSQTEIKKDKKGRLKSFLIWFLIFVLIIILLLGVLVGGRYWFFMKTKQGNAPGSSFSMERSPSAVSCGDSAECFEKNLVSCSSSFGEVELEDFAVLNFEIFGLKDNACVISFKVKELKQVPAQFESVPEFILKGIIENSSMDCMVPKEYYQEGAEKVVNYVLENSKEVCQGSLLDLLNVIEK